MSPLFSCFLMPYFGDFRHLISSKIMTSIHIRVVRIIKKYFVFIFSFLGNDAGTLLHLPNNYWYGVRVKMIWIRKTCVFLWKIKEQLNVYLG